MKRLTLILLLLAVIVCPIAVAQCDGNAHSGTYYVDNSCGTNGNGSTTACGVNGPFSSIANMQAKSGGYQAGNSICLRRGQTYRETLTMPSSGSSSSHIVLNAYGSGNPPTIKGSNPFGPWTLKSGSTYQVIAASTVSLLWKDGEFQNEGSGPTALNNHEWSWSAGVLYYREDENDLGSHVIEGAVRANGINNNSQSYWDINNVRIMHSDSSSEGYGIHLQGGTGFNISDCAVVESRALDISSTSLVVVNRCVFKYSHGGSWYPQFAVSGNAGVTIYNTVFRGSEPGQPSFELSDSATANIYNSLFDEYGGNAIVSTSSGTCNILNSIFTGAVSGWGNETMVRTGSGAVSVDYSLILPYGRDVTYFLKGITEGSHNLYSAPDFKGSVAKGYLIIGVDDTDWYRYFDEASKTADQYGYKVGFAAVASDMPNMPEAVSYLQDAINRGHWIASHSNSHADLSMLTGASIQYTGSGTAARMTIASGHLTTQVTGAASDNLNLDLAMSPYETLAHLCEYLAGQKSYDCSGTDWENEYTASTGLADVSSVDIRTQAYAAFLDPARYAKYEIADAHKLLTSYLKNPDGTPYSLDTFVYPFGMNVPDAAVQQLRSSNYLGARSTQDWLASPGWRTSVGVDLYSLVTTTGMSNLGELAYLWYDATCNDLSQMSRPFSCRNMTYSGTILPPIALPGAYSAVFNGTSAYAWTSDSAFDFHRGDGYWSAYIRPNALNRKQTLFYQGSDASNYHTLYLSPSGTVVYSILASGSETVHVETQGGLLSIGNWERVTLTFNQNTYKLFVGVPESASVTSKNRPGAYTGNFTIGAGGAPSVQDFYSGYMNGMAVGTDSFAAATAFLNTLSAQGGVIFLYGHADGGMPVGALRVLFQAKSASSANVMLDTFHNVLADLRSKGAIGADGRTLTWLQADGSDYHLLPNSPLINMGWDVGAPPTDADGNPRSGADDIGIYEFINTLRRSRSYWW